MPGTCGAIRVYLTNNGAATVQAIAKALSLPVPVVGKACQRMYADGRLEREQVGQAWRGACVYKLGRLPDPCRKPPRGKVLEIKAQLPVQRASIPAATSADYPAHLIERLPSEERPWTRYPRPGFSV